MKITLNARASTAKSLMPKAAPLTPRFRIRLAPSSPSPAVNSLCEEGCCSSDYEQDATHHAALLLGARDRRFVSGILRSSAAFWHRSALRIVQNCSSTSNRSARSLLVIEPPAQSDRAFNPLHRRTLERPSALAPKHTGRWLKICWRLILARHARFALRSMKPGRSSKVSAASSRTHPSQWPREQSWPSAS